MRYIILTTMFLCVWLFCSGAYGDVVVFTNGDRITGKIKEVVSGKLTLQTETAGEIKFDMSNIQTFSSDEPIEIHFTDGTVIKQRILSSEPGRINIEAAETVRAQSFDIAKIAAVNPPAKPVPKWHGSISAGFNSTHGNTKTERQNLGVDLSRRSENDRVTLKADYARGQQENPDTGEQQTTENWWRTRVKYDYFVSKKLYAFGDTRYEKDSIAELDRRMVVGGGAGYQWLESDDMNFSTEAGLASLYEKFKNATDSNAEVSMQLGYHFDKKLYKSVSFINDLTYYPSIDKFSDYYLTSSAEFRASVLRNLFTSLKIIFDYDATPAQGAGHTDVRYILSVGWNF